MGMRRMTSAPVWHDYGAMGAGAEGRALRRGRRVTVRQWEQGLLFRYGRLAQVLEAGAHRRWGKGFTLRAVDLRPWVLLAPMQEIPTADGVTVKLTVAGRVRVADATAYVTGARDPDQGLYLAIQVALRELVAATTLDDLLAGGPTSAAACSPACTASTRWVSRSSNWS